MCLCAFFFQQTGRRGQQSVMQQSFGQDKEIILKEIKKKQKGRRWGTRGSKGVRREVVDSKRKISRRGS